MIGIYKITSPKGRVYVGQSYDIKRRFTKYRRMDCEGQTRLYNSLKKYGVDAHKFEVICRCRKEDLQCLERYFQEKYKTITKAGLNCHYTNTSKKQRVFSEETKMKMSKAQTGKVISKEARDKMSKTRTGRPMVYSEEHKAVMSERRRKQALGKTHSMKTRKKMRESSLNKNSKIVLDTLTGAYYLSVREAADYSQHSYSALRAMLSGQNLNKTSLILI